MKDANWLKQFKKTNTFFSLLSEMQTISSCLLMWPQSCAYHMQHIGCSSHGTFCAPSGVKGHFSYWFWQCSDCIYLQFYFNRWSDDPVFKPNFNQLLFSDLVGSSTSFDIISSTTSTFWKSDSLTTSWGNVLLTVFFRLRSFWLHTIIVWYPVSQPDGVMFYSQGFFACSLSWVQL